MTDKKDTKRNFEMTVAKFKKKITASGNSGHIPVSKDYVGDTAHVVIKRNLLICKRCHETVSGNLISKDPSLCTYCYNGLKKLEALKKKGKLSCRVCNKEISDGEFELAWDDNICQECWIKEADEFSKKSGGKNKLGL